MVNLREVPFADLVGDGHGHAKPFGKFFGERVDFLGWVKVHNRLAVRLVPPVLDEGDLIGIREVALRCHIS